MHNPDLTNLQRAVIKHLEGQLILRQDSFRRDEQILNDIFAAYKGDIHIMEEPKNIQPVLNTNVMKNLLTEDLRDYIEGQVEVRLRGTSTWKLQIDWLE